MRKQPEISRPVLRGDAPPANPQIRSRMTVVALAQRGSRSAATRKLPICRKLAHEP